MSDQKCEYCGHGYSTDLAESFRDTLNLMDQMRWELRAGLRAAKEEYKRNKDPVVARHSKLLGREVNQFVKAFSAFAGELRKYERQQADDVANYSNAQKAELIISMVKEFPPDLQQYMAESLTRLALPPGDEEDGELVE